MLNFHVSGDWDIDNFLGSLNMVIQVSKQQKKGKWNCVYNVMPYGIVGDMPCGETKARLNLVSFGQWFEKTTRVGKVGNTWWMMNDLMSTHHSPSFGHFTTCLSIWKIIQSFICIWLGLVKWMAFILQYSWFLDLCWVVSFEFKIKTSRAITNLKIQQIWCCQCLGSIWTLCIWICSILKQPMIPLNNHCDMLDNHNDCPLMWVIIWSYMLLLFFLILRISFSRMYFGGFKGQPCSNSWQD